MFLNPIRILSVLTKQQRLALVMVQALVIFATFFEVTVLIAAGPFVTYILSDQIIPAFPLASFIVKALDFSERELIITWWSILYFIFLFLGTVISIAAVFVSTIFANFVGASISIRLYAKFLAAEVESSAKTAKNDQLNKIVNEVDRLTNGVLMPVMQLNARLCLLFGMLTVLMTINFAVTLFLFLGVASAYFFMFGGFSRIYLRNGKHITTLNADRYTLVINGYEAQKEIKIYGVYNNFLYAFTDASKDLAKRKSQNISLSLMPKYIVEFAAVCGLLGVLLYFSAGSANFDRALVADLVIFGLASMKLIPVLQQMYRLGSTYLSNTQAFISVEHHLSPDVPNYVDDKPSTKPEIQNKQYSAPSIWTSNLSFRHSDSEELILKKVNFKALLGELTVITGSSGAGKSTLLDVIMGLNAGYSGEIGSHEFMLNPANRTLWRGQISYVGQFPISFGDTIIKNVTVTSDQSDEINRRFNKACDWAMADFAVKSNLDKLTEKEIAVDELSGGQKQRLGLARAHFFERKILILDEPTASLDREVEETIISNLKAISSKRITIAVTHSELLIKAADRVYEMHSGELSQTFYRHAT